MSRRVLSAVSLLVGLITATGTASGQDLADVIVDLIDQNFELGANEIAGAQHTFHFGEATAIASGVNSAIVQQLTSATPLSTTSGGVALEWDPEINSFARKTSSFGPIFAERAETLGAGKFNFGLSYLRFDYDSIDGIPLRGGALGFDIQHQDTGIEDGTQLDNFVEGDLIRLEMNLSIVTETLALYSSFGISDRFDLSVMVPIVSVDLEMGVDAAVKPLSTAGFSDSMGRLVHAFPNGTQTTDFSGGGSASGIGDLVVRGKFSLTKQEGRGLAAAAELSLPTGDAKNLLGTGATGFKAMVIGSASFGKFSPHVNAGYSWFTGGATELSNQINLALGFDMPITEKVTLAADVVGRTLLDALRLQISQDDHLYRVCDGCTATDNDETLMEIRSTERDVLETSRGSLNLYYGTLGFKIRLPTERDFLLTTSVLYSLSSGGLQDEDLVAMIGLDFSF